VVGIPLPVGPSQHQRLHIDWVFHDLLEDWPLEVEPNTQRSRINAAATTVNQHADVPRADKDQAAPNQDQSCNGNQQVEQQASGIPELLSIHKLHDSILAYHACSPWLN